MVSEVLKRIQQAEAEAAKVLRCAEENSRKIEARNYTAIQQVRDNINIKINHAVKALEDELLRGSATVEASVEAPAKLKLQKAKDFIVSFIIGGAS